MAEPKFVGLMTAWCSEPWIEPALKQAIEYCDEVNVCVYCHSPELNKFEDNTADIVKKYKNKVKILNYRKKCKNHSICKADILNTMAHNSKLFEAGNWLWILDSDEFYTRESVNYIKKEIKQNSHFNQLCIQEKYFYINMHNNLVGDHHRLFRIEPENVEDKKDFCFWPTQNWRMRQKKISTIPRRGKLGMFHYGMLTNPLLKLKFWQTEYPGQPQPMKIEWMNKIYFNYDIERPQKWLELNEQLFGVKGCWFSDTFTGDHLGRPFRYDGEHPRWVRHLLDVKDFREYYLMKLEGK